jgi:hypothetical protein
MAISLTVFRAQVDGLLSADNDELSQLRRERQIKAALERYSRDRPDEVTEDITGDAGKYYGIVASLTSWVEGFSRVVAIEYPAPTVASDEAPTYLEPEDWDDDYWDGTTRYLWLPNHAPSAAEALRVRYTAPYAWTASTTITTAVADVGHGFSVDDWLYKEELSWVEATDARIATHQVSAVADVDNYTRALLEADPPVQDFFAICNLAGGLCAQAIADKYSRTSDSTIAVDSVDHLSRADQWSRRARELMALYADHMGIGGDGDAGTTAPAAGDFVDWDTAPGWPTGRDYLFHGRHTR